MAGLGWGRVPAAQCKYTAVSSTERKETQQQNPADLSACPHAATAGTLRTKCLAFPDVVFKNSTTCSSTENNSLQSGPAPTTGRCLGLPGGSRRVHTRVCPSHHAPPSCWTYPAPALPLVPGPGQVGTMGTVRTTLPYSGQTQSC